jgi:hypothetical protein
VRNTYQILIEKSEGTICLGNQGIDGIILLLLVFLKKRDNILAEDRLLCAPNGVEGGEFLTQLKGRSTSREWLCSIQFNDLHRMRLISPRSNSHFLFYVRGKHVTLCTSTVHEVLTACFLCAEFISEFPEFPLCTDKTKCS